MDRCTETEADCGPATPRSLSHADPLVSMPHCEAVSVRASRAIPMRVGQHRSTRVTSLGDDSDVDLEGCAGELDLERSVGCLDLCLVEVLTVHSKFDISYGYEQSKCIIQIQHHTYLKRTNPTTQQASVTSSGSTGSVYFGTLHGCLDHPLEGRDRNGLLCTEEIVDLHEFELDFVKKDLAGLMFHVLCP